MSSIKKPLITLPPTFDMVGENDKTLLKNDGVLEHFKKGQDIQKEGQIPLRQTFLHTGFATLQVRNRVLEIVGTGTIFGSTLTKPVPNTCTMRALCPTIAYSFSITALVDIWTRNPVGLLALLDVAILRVQGYQQFLHQLGTPSLEIRLGAILWRIGALQPDGSKRVPKEVSQAILAEVLRTTREEISRRKSLLLRMGVLLETDDGYSLPAVAPLILEINEKGV